MEVENWLLTGVFIVLFVLTLFFTINRSLVSNKFREAPFPGFLSFFLFTVCVSAPMTLANITNNYLIGIYATIMELFFFDIVFGILYCILAYLLVRAFLQRDGDAIFLGYGFLAVCLVSNLIMWTNIENFPYRSLVYCLVFGLFFYYSSGIEECIPSEKRYIAKIDQYVVGVSLLWVVMEFAMLYFYYGAR